MGNTYCIADGHLMESSVGRSSSRIFPKDADRWSWTFTPRCGACKLLATF